MLVQEGLECPTKDEFDHFDQDKNGVLTWSEWVSFQEWGQAKNWIDDVFWYIMNLDLNLKYMYWLLGIIRIIVSTYCQSIGCDSNVSVPANLQLRFARERHLKFVCDLQVHFWLSIAGGQPKLGNIHILMALDF